MQTNCPKTNASKRSPNSQKLVSPFLLSFSPFVPHSRLSCVGCDESIIARLNPSRGGRLPAVLEGFEMPADFAVSDAGG